MTSRTVQRLGALMAFLVVAGCGSAAPASSAPAPTPVPTAAPTPVPTPAPTPDVYKAFVAWAASPTLVLRADVSGTVDVGVSTRLAGSYEVDGASIRSVQVFTVGGKSSQSEQRVVSASGYTKVGEGPWMQYAQLSGANTPPRLATALASAKLTQKSGADGLHLTGEGAAIIDVVYSLLLIERTQSTFLDGSIDLLVGPDGVPLTLAVKVTAIAAGTKMTSALAYTFDAKPVVAQISAPTDPWDLHNPGHYYTLSTPPGWTADIETAPKDPNNILDVYTAPKPAVASLNVNCLAGTWTLAEWIADTNAYLTKTYGKKPTRAYDAKFGGAAVKVLEWANVKMGKYPTFVVNISYTSGKAGCDLRWYNDPGTESADYTTIALIGSSFAFK